MKPAPENHAPAGENSESSLELPEIASRILAAAVELFARKGYAATSVREIVQEAQVTNPMLYYYFDSKEGLFRVLTNLMHAEFLNGVRAVARAGGSFEETLIGICDVHLRGLREAPRAVEFVYSLLFGAAGSTPGHELYERHELVVEEVERVFEAAIDRGELTLAASYDRRWLVMQLLGIVNSYLMRGIKELQKCSSDEEREAWIEENAGLEASRQLVTFFLHGAGEVTK